MIPRPWVAVWFLFISLAKASNDKLPGHGALTVKTAFGSVSGFTANGTNAWRGIPYAAPPTEDRRFRPPQPPSKWNQVRDSTSFGPSCLQMGSPALGGRHSRPAWNSINVTNSDEDCLYLNVYAPAAATETLPVMVYFHAGEFRFGSSNDRESAWPYFANGTVLLVTANVRLGLMGFGALEAFRARDPSGSTGNYGMQDQRAVLQWVKANIKVFGGDPTRVTMFGESSGGSSVGFHLTSPKSAGLFSGAILESPGLTQSRTWEASVTNTQFAASALTSAGSEGCSWPTADKQEWITLPGLFATEQGHPVPLGLAISMDGALKRCTANPNCSMVYQKDTKSGLTVLYGGGKPGDMIDAQPVVFNMSLHKGHMEPSEVRFRVSDPTTVSDCLVKADARDLVALNEAPPFGDTFTTDAAAPTIDGVELTDALAHQARVSVPKGVALLGGSNLDEGTEFMDLTPALDCAASKEDFAAWSVLQFGEELGKQVPALYSEVEQPAPLCRNTHGPGMEGTAVEPRRTQANATWPWSPHTSTYWQAAMRAAGDSAIMCRTRDVLKQAFTQGTDAFWYFFTLTPTTSVNEDPEELPYMGAFHGAEVPFVFGDKFELMSMQEQSVSRAMACYWTNFATTGDPNTGSSGCVADLQLPVWPTIGKAGDAIEFSNTTIHKRSALHKTQCDVFAKYP